MIAKRNLKFKIHVAIKMCYTFSITSQGTVCFHLFEDSVLLQTLSLKPMPGDMMIYKQVKLRSTKTSRGKTVLSKTGLKTGFETSYETCFELVRVVLRNCCGQDGYIT